MADEKSETDERLMLAVRAGNVASLGVLFDRHHRLLHDFFARMTGSRAAADDLVQDVFLRILKYRQNFRDDSLFKAWLFRIARNAQADYFNKHSGETSFPESGFHPQSCSPLPGRELEQQQDVELLACAMSKLTVDKREVLVLSRYEEMKYEQIAEVLSCEVGTVKVRVHRALKELREIYLEMSRERSL
jgi:RNA polymerase sigma-70 factor (ECF subfamily)